MAALFVPPGDRPRRILASGSPHPPKPCRHGRYPSSQAMTWQRLPSSLLSVLLASATAAAGLRAQDPPKPVEKPKTGAEQSAREGTREAPRQPGKRPRKPSRRPANRARGNRAGRRAPILALKVGTIHPVEGDPIQNGVILIRGGRILALGPADKLRVPAGAQTLDYPEAHAYPGLVDALTTAYAPAAELGHASVNAGSDFVDALDATDEQGSRLVEAGITTAYVANRSSATWRGLGAVVRPQTRNFGLLADQRHGGLSLRLTSGTRRQHPLDRLKLFDKTGNVFDGLEDYEKKLKEHEEALAKYKKEYKAWLDHHKKNKGRKKGGGNKAGAKPAAKAEPGKTEKTEAKPAAKTEEKPANKPAESKPAPPTRGRPRGPAGRNRSGASSKKAGSGPKKPKYPKAFRKDPAKEALLKVAAGKLPLRIEAHRVDEIRAALFLAFDKELPSVVLEHCSAAGTIADELAQGGAPVVLCDLLPGSEDYAEARDASLPARLHKAGVSFCIASGDAQKAPNLALMAAYACGHGLDEKAALEAITLAPARVLGIDDKVGSLKRGKVADILITSGPLLSSDSSVLRVLAAGRTQFEAKPQKEPR